MNEDLPFPPALPAVIPSPIGPAISYSNIRAVTSRAERTLDGLEKKVRNRLASGANASGMVGAMLESKVRQRLADQLAPAEQLYQDYTDLIQNQIAGNLAPAVATLEDLQGTGASSQASQPNTETAGHGTPGGGGFSSPAVTPLTPKPAMRATGLARQLSAAAGSVAGGPPFTQFAQTCPKDTDAPIPSLKTAFMDWLVQHPQYPVTTASNNYFFYTPDCRLYTAHSDATPPTSSCGYLFFRATEDADLNKILAAEIISLFQVAGYNLTYTTITGTDCGTPVDCTVHPLDPSCPPDCKTHPEDPRCPPTTPTCPPPCIEVTCPPPIINVPPCPPLTPTSCVQIDLCDYDKFCKFIKDCIVQAKTDCALDNETAYTYLDCGGRFGDAQDFWLGSMGAGIGDANTLDDVVSLMRANTSMLTADDFSTGSPY